MNIVIVGQGAIGLLLYSHLYRYYQHSTNLPITQVSLCASSSKFTQFKQVKFTDNHQGNAHYQLHHATDADLANTDVLIMCVKSYQVKQALESKLPLLSKNCAIVLCHNGMGSQEALQEKISQPLLTLLLTHGAKKLSADHIVHTGNGTLTLGMLCGKLDKQRQKALTDLLNNAIPSCHWHENILEVQWLKLAINCVINPITAIHNIDNGLVFSGEYQAEIEQLISEVIAVAHTQGIVFNETKLYLAIKEVATKTAKNCSSMRSDVLANRMTEIDFINGYVIRLAKLHSIETPVNLKMYQAIKALS